MKRRTSEAGGYGQSCMARFYPLFSSSKGNSSYIGNENSGILIDAGVSCKRLVGALENNGISPEAVQAIFITHTHSDHIAGLKILTKKYNIPVYAQTVNLEILASSDKVAADAAMYSVDGRDIEVGGFCVSSFETPHDTPASCGYRIVCPDGKVIVTCTDLGEITPEVDRNLAGADMVLLESNYDERMLKNGSYPYTLKQRIASSHGHLSNSDCSKQLKKLIEGGTCRFVLGHLSQENNTAFIAESSAVGFLNEFRRNSDYLLDIASPDGCGMAVAF